MSKHLFQDRESLINFLSPYYFNASLAQRVTGVARHTFGRAAKRFDVDIEAEAARIEAEMSEKYHVSADKRYVDLLYFSDIHFGHEDTRALDHLLEHIKANKYDHLVDGGDRIDAYSVSKFTKSKSRLVTLQDELNRSKDFSKTIEEIADGAQIHFCIGNHEQRIPHYLDNNAPGIADLDAMNLRTLMGLDNWEVYGREGSLIHGLRVMHGNKVASGAGNTVRKEMNDQWSSVVQGHVHRAGIVRMRKGDEYYYGVEAGCLCRLDPEYVAFPDWQQSYAKFKLDTVLNKVVKVDLIQVD